MTLPKYLGIAKLRTLKNGNLEIVFKRNNQIFLTQPFYHFAARSEGHAIRICY